MIKTAAAESRAQESVTLLTRMQARVHPQCLFCGQDNPLGFNLDFQVVKPGMVRVRFPGSRLFQSYPETLHGGMTAALLDAVMTNALFSMEIEAVTGELVVRFLRPVESGCDAEAVGVLEQSEGPLFRLSARLLQHGKLAARATARFVDRSWPADRAESLERTGMKGKSK